MKFSKGMKYIFISLILWLAVEYITVWRTKGLAEWMSTMPWGLLQYLFIILIFWFFLFVKKWTHKKTFFVMIIVMYIFEALWQNGLLFSAWFLPATILLIQLWGFLTFIPFWIVNKTVKQNYKLAIFYCLWPVLGLIIAFSV